jgi:hypothetical protein
MLDLPAVAPPNEAVTKHEAVISCNPKRERGIPLCPQVTGALESTRGPSLTLRVFGRVRFVTRVVRHSLTYGMIDFGGQED